MSSRFSISELMYTYATEFHTTLSFKSSRDRFHPLITKKEYGCAAVSLTVLK